MYDTNRVGMSIKQHSYISSLQAAMRKDALDNQEPWCCAYVENWKEVKTHESESEIIFNGL